MVFAVSEGALRAVEKPTYQAPRALRLNDSLSETYAVIYRKQPEVRTVVDFLARNVAQLSLQTFRRVSDTDRERLRDHPVAQLLARPNSYTTSYRLIRSLVSDLGIYDFAVWLKTREQDRDALVRIPPRLVTIDGDANWLRPESFIIEGNSGKTRIAAKDIVYFRGYNPEDERYGLSPIETLRRALSEEYAAGQMREQILRNGARASGYIERPAGADWSPTARDRFRQGWRSQYSGFSATEAGGTPILEDGMKFVAASQSAVDLQYVESRKLTREEVASAYFIPPPMIGILDNASFSNITEQHKMLYQDTLGPILKEIQEEIALQILPDLPDTDGVYVEFNMAEKLRGSFEEQAAQLQSSVGAPFLTRNEARARANLPSVEGGDALVVPLNVLIDRPDLDETIATGALPALEAEPVEGLTADDVVKLVNAAAALIRSGFDPEGALLAVGLDPIAHLGLLPVTVQRPQEPDNVDQDIVDQLKSAAAIRAKALGRKARPGTPYEKKATDILSAFFARQEQSVRSAIGAKADAEWWNEARWNRELGQALLAFSLTASAEVARKQLERLGIDPDEYDVDRTQNYLAVAAGSTASSINAVTKLQLDAALASDEDPLDQVGHVFEVAKSSRAAQAGLTIVTSVAGFAAVEAVEQVRGERQATKTWVVTSSNPRASHAAMNGETVPIDSVFSNGAKWPGDTSALDVDDVAGCGCDVEISFE